MSESFPEHDEPSAKAANDITEDDEIDKRNRLLVEIWKQAVDTQKHFNDMCVKSRQLGLTFVAASLGAALYLFIRAPGGIGEGASASATGSNYAFAMNICGHSIILHVSLTIIVAALAAVYAVKKLDLGVYHQMLRGAVYFGEDIEEKHIKPLMGLRMGMTQAISHFSRNSDATVKRHEDGRFEYFGNDKKHAGEKLEGFYRAIMAFLVFLGVAIFVATNYLKAVG
jgi:hypothetical protein